MLIFGFDFETTGLLHDQDVVIEVGMCLWDTELHTAIKMMGFLVNHADVAITPKITEITGISKQMTEKYGYESERGLKQLLVWLQQADVMCAHNGREFDIKFLRSWADKYGYDLPDIPLIDTKTDLDDQMPERFSRKLVYMAADHGFLNPFPHRALYDVVTMLQILDKYDVEKVVEFAQTPSLMVEAITTFDQKELAKAAGYHWYKDAFVKRWQRAIKEPALELERARCREIGFEIAVVNG